MSISVPRCLLVGVAIALPVFTALGQAPAAGGQVGRGAPGDAVAPAAPGAQAPGAAAAGGRGGGRGAGDTTADFLKRPPVLSQAPDVERDLLLLPEGFKAQLVLSEPEITDPVGVTFDGNGRMYVLEMRTYMLD